MWGKRLVACRNTVDLSVIHAPRHRVALCSSGDLGLSFDGILASYTDLFGLKIEAFLISLTVL